MKWDPKHMHAGGMAVAVAMVIFGLALPAHLSKVSLNPSLNPDTVAHLLASRSCSTGEGCLLRVLTIDGTMGPTTPLGIQHGALVNHLMAVAKTRTGNPLAAGWVLAAMSALVGALMFLFGRKMWGLWAGLACAAAAGVFLTDVGHVLSHPAFTPLPATLYVVAACAHLVTGKGRHVFVAGFAVGVAAQLHLAAFVHVTGLIALVLMLRPQARRTAGILAAAGVVLPLAASPAMFFVIKRGGGGAGGPPDLLLSAALLIAGAGLLLLSLVHQRSGATARVVRFLAFSHLPFAIALLLFGHGFTTRYMLPLLPGLVLLAAAGAVHAASGLAHRFGARGPTGSPRAARLATTTAIAIAAIVLLVKDFSIPSSSPGHIEKHHAWNVFTLSDARAVADLLEREGWTYREVFRGLRGGEGYWYLLQGLGYYMASEEPGEDHRPEPRRALTVLGAPRRPPTLPPGWIWLGEGDSPGLLVLEYEPRLHWDRFEVCFAQAGREDPCEWHQLRYAFKPPVHGSLAHLVYNRGNPQIEHLLPLRRGDVVLMAVPIRLPAGSDPRFITLGGSSRYGCAGAIVAVEGVGYAGPLPARSVWIDGSDREARGTVVFGWELRGCNVGFAMDMPPAVMELDAPDLRIAIPLLEEERRPETPSLLSVLADIGSHGLLDRPVAGTVRTSPPCGERAKMKTEPLAPYRFAFLSVVLIALGMLGGMVSWGAWAVGKHTVATEDDGRGPASGPTGGRP